MPSLYTPSTDGLTEWTTHFSTVQGKSDEEEVGEGQLILALLGRFLKENEPILVNPTEVCMCTRPSVLSRQSRMPLINSHEGGVHL